MAEDDAERKEFDWDLHINVPTIGVHRTLRVTSNESIGAVMIKLATKLGRYVWGKEVATLNNLELTYNA